MFFYILGRRSEKSRKNGIFPNGLVHDFDQKFAVLPSFYFRKIGQDNVFHGIVE